MTEHKIVALMAESEEELKSLSMKVKVESEKVGLKLNIKKMKIVASGPITSWQIDGETMEIVRDFTRADRGIGVFQQVAPPTKLRIEFPHDPRSKRLLISWLQSPSAVILKPPKIKSDTVSTVSHLFAMK